MESRWSHDPKVRPAFPEICDLVRGEIIALEGSMSQAVDERSQHLLDRSHSSRNAATANKVILFDLNQFFIFYKSEGIELPVVSINPLLSP